MTVVRRETASGGSVAFHDESPASVCAICERTDPMGIRCVAVVAFEARTLTTALCGTCLAEALAILFGRQHVADGGSVDDLRYDDPLG